MLPVWHRWEGARVAAHRDGAVAGVGSVSLPHLLLVDDSESVLAFEKAALAGHYVVSTAVNGREALTKVAQLRPAAVLLDLSMPEMDGDEVLAQMQQDPQLAGIPVIIVS